jgi:2-oxoisovalerate dehydrogenase E2 component (dihydrolipoyl transacylase)
MSGGTITVSNIGNIGGTYLSPVIVDKEVSILGIGRMRTVPAFDEQDRVVKKQVCNFSWSADHRVVDGATMARAADVVRRVVEEPDVMVMHLR